MKYVIKAENPVTYEIKTLEISFESLNKALDRVHAYIGRERQKKNPVQTFSVWTESGTYIGRVPFAGDTYINQWESLSVMGAPTSFSDGIVHLAEVSAQMSISRFKKRRGWQ